MRKKKNTAADAGQKITKASTIPAVCLRTTALRRELALANARALDEQADEDAAAAAIWVSECMDRSSDNINGVTWLVVLHTVSGMALFLSKIKGAKRLCLALLQAFRCAELVVVGFGCAVAEEHSEALCPIFFQTPTRDHQDPHFFFGLRPGIIRPQHLILGVRQNYSHEYRYRTQ